MYCHHIRKTSRKPHVYIVHRPVVFTALEGSRAQKYKLLIIPNATSMLLPTYTPPGKANITMEHPPFETVFPIENGRFSSLSCFRLSETGQDLVSKQQEWIQVPIWVIFYHSPGAKQRFDGVFGKGMTFLDLFRVIVYSLPWESFVIFPTTLSKSKLWFMEVTRCLVTLSSDYGMKKQFGVQAGPLCETNAMGRYEWLSVYQVFGFAFGLGL